MSKYIDNNAYNRLENAKGDKTHYEKYVNAFDYKYGNNNKRYIFNEPYRLIVSKINGNDVPFWYCVQDENLGIEIMEESQAEAIEAFYSEIDMLWNVYATEEDDKLAKRALLLKTKVRDLIKEVKLL